MPDLPPTPPPDGPRVRLVLEVPLAVWVILCVTLLNVAWAAFVWADEKQADGVERRRAQRASPAALIGAPPPASPPQP